jgi:membrane protein DedA with SNARE-associated domain
MNLLSWQGYIESWGYVAVFLGSLVEGESVILVAGFLAHEGYLSLPKIILISFLGSLLADQTSYFIGRSYGNVLIAKFPSLKPRVDKAFYFLKRYDNLFILSCRFIYGVRTISPFVIGACGVGVFRFVILNFIAALIWSVSSCVIAYYFAYLVMDKLLLVPKALLAFILSGLVIGYGIYWWRNRQSK